LIVSRFCGVESQKLGKFAPVLGIFVDSELQVLTERLVELLEIILVLRNFGEEIETLLDDVLADDLENLILLESFAGDVQREILRVHDTFDEVEVLGNDVLAVVHDEYSADIELDVITLLFGLEEIEGSPNKKISTPDILGRMKRRTVLG
jgi:hypothetical protein